MKDLDSIVARAQGKAAMHKAIDDLGEGYSAILLVDRDGERGHWIQYNLATISEFNYAVDAFYECWKRDCFGD